MDTLLDRALTLLRGQLGVARAVGSWAQKACEQALSGQQGSAGDTDGRASAAGPRKSPGTAVAAAASPSQTAIPEQALKPTSGQPTAAVEHTTAPSADLLGIAGYDQLAASQIVARLDALSPQQRVAIADHERNHRRRRTVLHRIAQLESD